MNINNYINNNYVILIMLEMLGYLKNVLSYITFKKNCEWTFHVSYDSTIWTTSIFYIRRL